MRSKYVLILIILFGFFLPFTSLVIGAENNQIDFINANIKVGDRGKDWTLKEIFSDQSISFTNYYGKVLVLDFFATWCTPCIESFNVLRDLNAYYSSSQVAIVSIDTEYNEKTESEIEDFASDNNVNWEVVIDSINLADDYSVLSIPTFFIFNQRQRLAEIVEGYTSFASMKQSIDTVLAANQRATSEIWSKYWYIFILVPTVAAVGVLIFVQRRKIVLERKAEIEKEKEERKLRERKRKFRR
jgi:thiol-disulfide isomerase/thioredoxin